MTIVTPSIRKIYKDLIKQVVEDLHKPIFVYLDPDKQDCPNCFVAGILVETPAGLKAIEDFSPGDLIFDGQGKPRIVSKVFFRHGLMEFTRVRCHGNSVGIEATSNHKLMVYNNEGSLYSPIIGSSAEKEIGDVVPGDIIRKAILPIPERPLESIKFPWKSNKFGPKKKIDEVIAVTDDFLFAYGLYLAEGCTSKGRQAQYCLNIEELEQGHKVSNYWKKLLGVNYSVCSRSGSDKSVVFEIYSSHLADFFDKKCGHLAENKYICDDLYYKLNKQQTLKLLEGFYFGDGHQELENRTSVTTVSRKLALQVHALLISCGFEASICSVPSKLGKDGILRQAAYTVRYWEEDGFLLRGTYRDDNFRYMVVKDVARETRHEDVFNLEVETEHSYIADGFSVQNCIYDRINKKSSGKFDTSFTSPVVIFGNTINPIPFSRGRCPVCFGEGHLEKEKVRNVKALVKWNPGGAEDLEVLPVGREGKAVVRIKILRTDFDVVKNATYFLIDGVRCELIKPPTIRGLGKQEELVVAFLQEVEPGKDVKK